METNLSGILFPYPYIFNQDYSYQNFKSLIYFLWPYISKFFSVFLSDRAEDINKSHGFETFSIKNCIPDENFSIHPCLRLLATPFAVLLSL